MERANFLLRQAFEEDEQGNEKDAIELYLNAAEMCIEAVSNNDNGVLTFAPSRVQKNFFSIIGLGFFLFLRHIIVETAAALLQYLVQVNLLF